MLKAFRRYGLANTGLILALGLLPLINLLGTAVEHQGTGPAQAGFQQAIDPKIIAPLSVAIDVAPRFYLSVVNVWHTAW